MRNYQELLEAQWAKGKFVCVGLDSEFGKIPVSARRERSLSYPASEVANTIVHFNEMIVRSTMDIAGAYKLNYAFYAGYGGDGIEALHRSIRNIHIYAPEAPVILDSKDMDIGNTNAGYVKMAFEYLRADAITISPYLGRAAAEPFLDRKEKGIIILCHTCNPGASEYQNLFTLTIDPSAAHESEVSASDWLTTLGNNSLRLYERVALDVATTWNRNRNCMLMVGDSEDALMRVRKLAGDIPILTPITGVGDVQGIVKAGRDSRGKGLIISSSHDIIFASDGPDFALVARSNTLALNEFINKCR